MKNKSGFFVPSISDVIFLTIFLILSLAQSRRLLIDCDTGWHIQAGQFIIDKVSVPTHDMFSFISPPLQWTAHEWLSEVIMAMIHRVSGLTGIVIFFSFLIALTYYLLFKYIRSQRVNIIITIIIVLLALLSSVLHWLARPHIFSLLFAVIWYCLLDSYQYGTGTGYISSPIMLLWANLHEGL
jgi:hypothetical protein